jgi:Helix-turn-helix domain
LNSSNRDSQTILQRDLDEDAEREAQEPLIWTLDQLKVLNEYALPLERIFLLLGLNCAYGADQAGRLRVNHLRLAAEGRSHIQRVRRKKKTISIHQLWQQTAEGLRWALRRRERQSHESEFLLVTDSGRAYWSKTKGGNRSQAIPNLWGRLLDRIRKHHPDFPQLPYNSLRDTSANMVRQKAGQEIALLYLAHKHQSKDENLRRYTHPTRKRHFRVLRWLEKKLDEVFSATGPDPWAVRSKNYIGLGKVKEIRQLHEQGLGVGEIATRTGVSTTTVYRHITKNGQADGEKA